jgi:hypothetical protein
MNKLLSLLSIALLLPIAGYSQFTVKTKEEAKVEKGKRTAKLIGKKTTGLLTDFGLYYIEKEDLEYLTFEPMKTHGVFVFAQIDFSSAKEEADFYKFVLGLYDNYKETEVTLGRYRIVPRKKSLFGSNDLIFDIYPTPDNDSDKLTTYMINKKSWINLFQNSRVHKLD